MVALQEGLLGKLAQLSGYDLILEMVRTTTGSCEVYLYVPRMCKVSLPILDYRHPNPVHCPDQPTLTPSSNR